MSQIDVLVEGAILGAIKQRATVDVSETSSVESLVEQVAGQLVGPSGNADVTLPAGTEVEVFDSKTNTFVTVSSISQITKDARLRLSLPSDAARSSGGRDATNKATMNVVCRATSLLVESIFSSFGECVISGQTLDTVLQACSARADDGTASAVPCPEDLALYKASVLEGYEAAKKVASRNMALYELQEKRVELETAVAELSRLLELQREEADLEHNTHVKALAEAGEENDRLLAEVRSLREEIYSSKKKEASIPETPAPAVEEPAPKATAAEEPATAPTPAPSAPVSSEPQEAERAQPAPAPIVVEKKKQVAAEEPQAAPAPKPQQPVEEAAPAPVAAAQESPAAAESLAPVPPVEPSTDSSRATRHRDVVPIDYSVPPYSRNGDDQTQEEPEEPQPVRQIITCFYNRFDPKLRRTAKLGRNVSVNACVDGVLAELRAVVSAAFHEPDLELGFVDRNGKRVCFTRDEQLGEFIGRQSSAGSRPVVQCFSRDEMNNTIRQIGESPMRLARSPVPPPSTTSNNTSTNNSLNNDSYALTVVNNNRATSPTYPPRPSSAMSSRCQTPFDYIAGKDLDDRAIEAEFANLANGQPYILREDVIRYLDDKYDSVGLPQRHSSLVDTLFGKIRNSKRDKVRFTFEEFALILLRHSQS